MNLGKAYEKPGERRGSFYDISGISHDIPAPLHNKDASLKHTAQPYNNTGILPKGTDHLYTNKSASNNTSPLIEFRGVTKVYGKGQASVNALRGIDFCIYDGDFLAVMGPSGSGKSTCMNILGCLDTPTSGSFIFRGINAGRLSRDQRALLRRHYLGFIFQGYDLLNRTSAIENVELPLIYRGLSLRKRRTLALQALEGVGLKGWEKHTPGELSGGQQQRVAIARAIVSKPAILLADEPTGNLDTARSREIMELLSTFNREQGITIVMVTHDPDMAAYARRIIKFLDGTIEPGESKRGPV